VTDRIISNNTVLGYYCQPLETSMQHIFTNTVFVTFE